MAGILICRRCTSVLLSSYTPRLARLVLLEDLGAGQEGHDAWLLNAIIHELVLPEQNADKTSAVFDLAMPVMAFNDGMERTGTQWRELLGQAGF